MLLIRVRYGLFFNLTNLRFGRRGLSTSTDLYQYAHLVREHLEVLEQESRSRINYKNRWYIIFNHMEKRMDEVG